MAWRIAKHIIKGEFDNRQKNLITGTLWLAGKQAPINLELSGNFLRDMAGCLLQFENPKPVPGDVNSMSPIQVGNVGDMTASRKVNIIDQPYETIKELGLDARSLPKRKANCLYLEWFSETDGRIVIESTDFTVSLSAPTWTMNDEDEVGQASANREGFRLWLEHLSELESLGPEEEDQPFGVKKKPMNEFEWEKIMKDSDKKNERLNDVLEKYHGHPDSEKLIAREMGWTWVEEELEAQERGIFIDDEDEFEDDELLDDMVVEHRDPNPLTEGVDWVRDGDGSIEHPLALKALHFSANLWKGFEESGLLEETSDSRIFEWAGIIEGMSVRLSNTLGDLAFDDDVDSGFIVAGLKRCVHQVHQALNMIQEIQPLNIMSVEDAKNAQKVLFDLRQEIINMMRIFRNKA